MSNGKKQLYHFKTFCYKSVAETMSNFLNWPIFSQLCKYRKERNGISGVMTDIHDGNVWKEFCSDKCNGFLTKSHSYGMMLNVVMVCC